MLKNISPTAPSLLFAGLAILESSAAVNVKFNFQPNASATPAGFVKDFGLAFDLSRGYGWVTEASLSGGSHIGLDLQPNSRDRGVAGIAPELNSLIQFQDPIVGGTRVNTRGAWEYALPPGTYKVVVSVGDPAATDSRHFLNAEGVALIHDFVPTMANPFKKDSAYVTVNDGRLTLDGLQGTNSKINFVQIQDANNPGPQLGRLEVENLDGVPYPDRLVFSRINAGISNHRSHDVVVLRLRNTGSGNLTVNRLAFSAPIWTLPNQDAAALPITIAPGAFRDIPVKFVENSGPKGIRQGELVVGTDDPASQEKRIQLAGAYMQYPEGDFEVWVPDILNAFGYSIRLTYPGQALGAPNLVVGEEIVATTWRRARSSKPVTVRQLAAYHGCCVYETLFEMIGTGGGSFRQGALHGQSLLPLLPGGSNLPAAGTFNPTSTFTFRIDGYTQSLLSSGYRGVRIWPARDRSGALIPDAFFVIQDYVGVSVTNYDFNDNLYLVTNIRPDDASADPNVGGLYPGASNLVLDFNANMPGTILDKNGQTTGFHKVQSNGVDRSNVQDSYRPGLIERNSAAGTLTLTTTSGTNAGLTNSLVNGLTAAFDGRATRFSVRALLNAPGSILIANGQQAGVLLGSDRDNGVRLIAGIFTAGGPFSVRFQRESNAGTTTISTTAIPTTGLQKLELILFGDPSTGEVTGGYRTTSAGGTSAVVALPGTAVWTGTGYHTIFDRRSYGGIMASHGTAASTQVDFDRFAVQSEAGAGSGLVRLINVGGAQYTAVDGRTWGTDAGLYAPSTAQAEYWGPTSIEGTADDLLYETYRANLGNLPMDQRALKYEVPVGSPRSLIVKLHFAENWWGAPGKGAGGSGKRVFDITVEGKKVLADFDITPAVGGALRALVVPLENVQVNDGNLSLALQAKEDYAALSAIEILQP